MKSYFCYIHLAGSLTPELRTIAAPDDERLPEMIARDLPEWPPMERIERIEVCTMENQLMFSITPREALAYYH
ncbi:MAG TPA: hypothetical protein VEA79_08125 [Phenylobacterium sp.]|nr:hypothetical protein [Phenylobacterium sp.]